MRKFLLLIAVALFSTATYAQLWNASISAVGAMDAVDFNSPAAMDKDGNLYVTGTQTVGFDFAASGYSLCIVDTKGSHADLTPDYAAIPEEMKSVNMLDCIECGCCSFVCPSRRPLVETNRIAKAELRNIQAAKKN